MFDSAIALALQSSSNGDCLNVPAQDLHVIFTEIHIG